MRARRGSEVVCTAPKKEQQASQLSLEDLSPNESVQQILCPATLRWYYADFSFCKRAKQRVKGIEPSCAAWEAAILPLNYTREGTEIVDFRLPIATATANSASLPGNYVVGVGELAVAVFAELCVFPD